MESSHNQRPALLTPSNVIARNSRRIPNNSTNRIIEATEAAHERDRAMWGGVFAPVGATAAATTGRRPVDESNAARRRRPQKKKNDATAATTTVSDAASTTPTPNVHDQRSEPSKPEANVDSNSKSRRRNKKKSHVESRNDQQRQQQQEQHAWWRNQLPPDAVDPITLDPLDDLLYPPFALVGMEPYAPIDWPPEGESDNVKVSAKGSLSEEMRQRQILEQQWGTTLTSPDTSTKLDALAPQNRHVNLFDGRALAYYMVSQLQFIDPLNRRDLVRDELVHLDRYLRRHGFVDLNVTEAYDAKGVTISTAGSAATTATGRALILQQEARVLLNALFGTHNHAASALRTSTISNQTATATITTSNSNNRTNPANSFMQQYEAYQSSQDSRPRRTNNTNRGSTIEPLRTNETVAYMESGLVIIDDDENPGLRGNASEFVPTSLYSAGHIISRHGQGGQNVQEQDFPTLAPTTPSTVAREPSVAVNPETQPRKALPKAKTLSKIGKMVKKTSPEEQHRQWEAREEARRKAALASLNLGGMPEWRTGVDGTTQAITSASADAPPESLLDRNRAFAEALGVKPATQRTTVRSGWTRPSEGDALVDEFGNELNATLYPNALVQQARDVRLDVLLKLEKKWKTFLADDTAASLPLNPMERSLRVLVHEYAAYWKLHTESFDPEPRRYIHCVKLRDTSAPYPLLTDVLQNWRAGRPASATALPLDHPLQQTAGQPTRAARELPMGMSRVPLSLKPRSTGAAAALTAGLSGVSIGGAPSLSMMDSEAGISNSRFSILADGRERPKLELQKRTLPTELPPFEAQSTAASFDASEELERQRERHRAKVQKEKQEVELKQRVLAAAFDSDDEDHRGTRDDDSESDWEEQKAVYTGSDEE